MVRFQVEAYHPSSFFIASSKGKCEFPFWDEDVEVQLRLLVHVFSSFLLQLRTVLETYVRCQISIMGPIGNNQPRWVLLIIANRDTLVRFEVRTNLQHTERYIVAGGKQSIGFI